MQTQCLQRRLVTIACTGGTADTNSPGIRGVSGPVSRSNGSLGTRLLRQCAVEVSVSPEGVPPAQRLSGAWSRRVAYGVLTA